MNVSDGMTKVAPSDRVRLLCRGCRGPVAYGDGALQAVCDACGRQYPVVNGVVVFGEHEADSVEGWSRFYNQWHVQTAPQAAFAAAVSRPAGGVGSRIKQQLKKSAFLRAVHDRLYFHECRKTWFLRKSFRGSASPRILDLGCGKGYPTLTEFGRVSGVDLSVEALAHNAAHNRYETLVQSDLRHLPFDDNQFDAVVSIFVYGHIPNENKDLVLQEVHRVLKPNGRLFWVIETDNDNFCLSFAKQYPDIYWDKVIMQYGHVGLEYPNDAMDRFRRNGFFVRGAEKTWGPIWSVSDYLEVFDNAYVHKARIVRAWVTFMRFVAARRPLEVVANAILGLVAQILDRVSGLDQTMGLLLSAEKRPRGATAAGESA